MPLSSFISARESIIFHDKKESPIEAKKLNGFISNKEGEITHVSQLPELLRRRYHTSSRSSFPLDL